MLVIHILLVYCLGWLAVDPLLSVRLHVFGPGTCGVSKESGLNGLKATIEH